MPKKTVPICYKQQDQMFEKWKAGDHSTFAYFQEQYRGLAVKYTNRGTRMCNHVPREDFMQLAALGMWKALETHDPEKGRMASWMESKIRAEVYQFAYANRSALVSNANSRVEKRMQTYGSRAVEKYQLAGHKGFAAVKLAAEELGVTPEWLERSLSIHNWSTYSNANRDDNIAYDSDDFSEEDTVGGAPSSQEATLTQEAAANSVLALFKAAGLNEREIVILRMRNDHDFTSLDSVAAHLGISRERVRHLEIKALAKLQAAAQAKRLTFQDVW